MQKGPLLLLSCFISLFLLGIVGLSNNCNDKGLNMPPLFNIIFQSLKQNTRDSVSQTNATPIMAVIVHLLSAYNVQLQRRTGLLHEVFSPS